MQRRDLRRGQQRGVAHTLAPDAIRLEISWGGQLPGRVDEEFRLNARGQLEVRGLMDLGGKRFDVRQLYNRSSGGEE
jgi:hypothetical protein